MCAVMIALHVGLDRRAERDSSARLEIARGAGQLEVRVLRGVAVSREVLRAGGDVAALEPRHERPHVPRDELRVGAERADADHGVVAGSS